MTTPNAKVLFITFDAAERDLLIKWADEGRLPNIQSLCQGGIVGEAPALPGFGSGALWPSFARCVNPARHGRYFNRHLKDNTYEIEKFQWSDDAPKQFWTKLSDAGKRVAMIDLPYAELSPQINGLEIANWGIHNPLTPEPAVQPESARGTLDQFGTIHTRQTDLYGRNLSEQKEFLDGLVERVHIKAEVASHHLNQGGWDLFLMCFDESHAAGHASWHLHDVNHPDYDPEVARELGDPILRVYEAMDAAVGQLIAAAGVGANVILFSGTGMTSNYNASMMLDDILAGLEGAQAGLARPTVLSLKKIWHRVPPRYRGRFRKYGRQLEQTLVGPDRARRKAFALPHNDIAGAIRVNLEGREPDGMVKREDYFAFCDQLAADLMAIRNMDTGEPIIRDVVIVQREHDGPWIERMPDLLPIWNRTGHPITAIHSQKLGEIVRPYTGNRSGDHTEHGFFAARGPGIPAGRAAQPISIFDFGPTVAQLLDTEIADTQGVPVDFDSLRETIAS